MKMNEVQEKGDEDDMNAKYNTRMEGFVKW